MASCPSFTIAGSSSLVPLVDAWQAVYLETCPGQSLPPMAAVGSSEGAARVCGTSRQDAAVDIGAMARPFVSVEASATTSSTFECKRSPRSVVQVEVALEGISVVTSATGVASACLEILGGGLSLSQLRWIFSNGVGQDEVLVQEAVPFLDSNHTTFLWSELHEDCAAEEIEFALSQEMGMDATGFFEDVVFDGNKETFRNANSTEYFEDISLIGDYLKEHPAAVSFVQLSSFFATENQKSLQGIAPVAILNDEQEVFVAPKGAAFGDDSYPLTRRLFLNINKESLELTQSFLEVVFSPQGQELLSLAGYWPLDEWERILMATRLQLLPSGGISLDSIRAHCSKTQQALAIAGSSTVFPVARLWSRLYQFACPDVDVVLEQGGSSGGAGRVCANEEKGGPVDIGNMSREWKSSEAEQDGFVYSCLKGDTTRSAIQVDVAIDGLTVAASIGGTAAECIQLLGGLTIDQLRWMFTNYNDLELQETGWDPSCLKNSDNDSRTHLWSELDSRCPRIEIRIAGPNDTHGTHDYFKETVLKDHKNGEDFDANRPVFGYHDKENDDNIAYLREHGEAVAYFGYSYYYDNRVSLVAAAIENDAGAFVTPADATVADGTYNPLARKIYMNLLNDPEVLQQTVPFLEFGLSEPSLVAATGYIPLPLDQVETMLERVQNAPYGVGDDDSGLSIGVLVGIVAGIVLLVGGVLVCAVMYKKKDMTDFAKSVPVAMDPADSRDRKSEKKKRKKKRRKKRPLEEGVERVDNGGVESVEV